MNAKPPSEHIPIRGSSSELSEELRRLGVRLGVQDLLSTATTKAVTTNFQRDKMDIESLVPGQVWDTPYGPCFVVETRYSLEHSHGNHRLSALSPLERPSPLLAWLARDERLSGMDFRSAIFFDIETTGLGIGAGMYAFMVGFGVFEEEQFCLRQYFMRDYNEEQALLYLLEQQMHQHAWWVSFNGRYFDLPVLQARFICAQREMPLAQAPHLDLLYPARKLWRRRLRSCALSSLEVGVLGMTRESDVPGWLIPELYFDYVRYGNTEYIPLVFIHNALDVLSLVTLTAKIDAMLRDPLGEAVEHAADMYSLGAILAAQGQWQAAQRAYEQAVRRQLPSAQEEDALYHLSLLYKKTGQVERATLVWQALRAKNKAQACVELAKHYEHRQRDYLSAARLVCEALALENLPAKGECSPKALKQRLARLKDKMGEGGLPMPHIESYSFGKIQVDGKTYTSDLIILPGGVRPGWWRKEGHSLHRDDLQEVVEARPSVLVIGTGNVGLMKVPPETLDYLTAQGIRVEWHPTAAACQRYNELAKAEQAAAALHLTC